MLKDHSKRRIPKRYDDNKSNETNPKKEGMIETKAGPPPLPLSTLQGFTQCIPKALEESLEHSHIQSFLHRFLR